ncbi:hypothetical protein ACOME3_002776 [Neoechinorhynchus agilis]
MKHIAAMQLLTLSLLLSSTTPQLVTALSISNDLTTKAATTAIASSSHGKVDEQVTESVQLDSNRNHPLLENKTLDLGQTVLPLMLRQFYESLQKFHFNPFASLFRFLPCSRIVVIGTDSTDNYDNESSMAKEPAYLNRICPKCHRPIMWIRFEQEIDDSHTVDSETNHTTEDSILAHHEASEPNDAVSNKSESHSNKSDVTEGRLEIDRKSEIHSISLTEVLSKEEQDVLSFLLDTTQKPASVINESNLETRPEKINITASTKLIESSEAPSQQTKILESSTVKSETSRSTDTVLANVKENFETELKPAA